ncbi:MAG: MCE family protein [Oleiphilaceae bacterium]|nr:MCE family protein [Oleiphilaceae bacterium]
METRAHHVIIGLFIIVGFLLALGFGVWLKSYSEVEATERYRIIFREAVTGLSEGSQVLFRGLPIGEVEQLALDPEDPNQVVAEIMIAADTPVNESTEAQRVFANITGAANIQLTTRTLEAPPLRHSEGKAPVIVAERSPIQNLREGGEELLVEVRDLMGRAARVLSPQNLDRIDRIMANFERLTADMADPDTGVGQTLSGVSGATQEAQKALTEAQRLLTSADNLLASQAAPLLSDGRGAAQSLARTSEQLNRILLQNEESLSQVLEAGAESAPAIRALQRSLETLDRLLRRFEQSPRGFFGSDTPTQEFSP